MKYHLKFWGADTENLLSMVNLQDTDYFFISESNRNNFKNNLLMVINKYGFKNIIFAEYEGEDVDKELYMVFDIKDFNV